MKSAKSIARIQHTPGRGRRDQGVALVVTLILLAMITFLAVAFLVISRSERGGVATISEQTAAKLAADAALEAAKVDLVLPMVAFNNPFAADTIVSTNYINDFGFIPNRFDATNVNYEYRDDGSLLSQQDYLQNLNNLLYRPRVPVFMRDRDGQMQFQWYLDINRNGRPEPTGLLVVTNELNDPVVDSNGVPVRSFFVGDPQWIGGLEFPDRPHSGTNRFLWRYAYVVAPIGTTLDLNYMHNAGRFLDLKREDGFIRNQGVGTWELNLAAFFTDLNTNMWLKSAANGGRGNGLYTYRVDDLGENNEGAGFEDATALLRYRYAGDWASLWPPTRLFANASSFLSDGYDNYGSGALVVDGRSSISDPDAPNRITRSWPGSYSTNRFISPTDLFDHSKTRINVPVGTDSVTERLEEAGRRISSYDRYTFHRLLSQLGTESAPETDRINVNYTNVINGRVVSNLETNFGNWTPIDFFTNAANRLLANAGFAFTVTNIEIFPRNQYTPAVHRALQLAANIYEVTAGKVSSSNVPALPTVFRPHFETRTHGTTNFVYIAGYSELGRLDTGWNYRDLYPLVPQPEVPSFTTSFKPDEDMVYGVPLVIGARKGFPNFNEFSMDTVVKVGRKLEFRRNGAGNIAETNVMYTLSLSNQFGVEFWNSYAREYPRPVRLGIVLHAEPEIRDHSGTRLFPSQNFQYSTDPLDANALLDANTWRAFRDPNKDGRDGSMITPLIDVPKGYTSVTFAPTTNGVHFLPHSTFSFGLNRLIPITPYFERRGREFPVPRWTLKVRTRLIVTIMDIAEQRIVDYVNLAQTEDPLDLTDLLQRNSVESYGAINYPYRPDGQDGSMWATNRYGSRDISAPTFGILNQIAVSLKEVESPSWPAATNAYGIDFFRAQFTNSPVLTSGQHYSLTNVFYAPYSPAREIRLFTSWQANDPLVHYTIGDLTHMGRSNRWGFDLTGTTVTNLGRLNGRYDPWGGHPLASSERSTRKETGVKDAGVKRSDDWDFPTNKIPNIGWLGRVHRGTPWQTVYLKSKAVNPTTWLRYAGSGIQITNYEGFIKTSLVSTGMVVNDARMSMPTNDWAIPDIFTASLYENATRGQLSINQTNLASWSAVLAGVPVLTNQFTNSWTVIQPAAVDPALQVIVDGISRTRDARQGRTFRRLAEICSVPELTDRSPFLDSDVDLLSDPVMERIPQQVLGLLRCDSAPRFVVYSYGQALKPADRSVQTGGPYNLLCTNYQVTAEVATRAVVRVEGIPENPKVIVENFNVLPPE